MKKKSPISEAELEIMEVIWDANEPISAYDIRQRLNQKQNWERTTVLTFIRRLVEKGFLHQEKREVYYYSANLDKEEYRRKETSQLIEKMYQGSSKNLIAALFEEKSLTSEDITELREYLSSLEKH